MNDITREKIDSLKKGRVTGELTEGCLVLEGGAFRGLYTAGVLDVFLENGILIRDVMGVSAGALNGLTYSAGLMGAAARGNLIYREDSRYVGFKALLKNRGLFGFDYMFKVQQENEGFSFDLIDEDRKFIATVTNVDTGRPEYMDINKVSVAEDKFRIIQASASMPLVSAMVRINGSRYLDGGCSKKVPIQQALEMSEKTVVIRTRDRSFRLHHNEDRIVNRVFRKYPNFLESQNNINRVYNDDCELMEKLHEEKRIYMLNPSVPINIARLESDTDVLFGVYELGRRDAISHLEEIKEYLK